MADTTNKVTVKVLADVSSFKKTIKETTSMSKDLNSLSQKFRKSGLKEHTQLSKISRKFNLDQRKAGKEAYKLELDLQGAMRKNIGLLQRKQKEYKGSATAIKDEVSNLKKLHREYARVQRFRKSTGFTPMSERISGAAAGAGRMAGGAAAGLGTAAGGALMGLGAGIVAVIAAGVGYLTNMVISQIRSGYASYINYGQARGGLAGMGNPRRGVEGAGERFGFSRTETVQQMRSVGRQTGNINAVTQAQRVSRMFGGDVGEVGGFMGVLTRGGQGFGGKAGKGGEKQLIRIMGQAFTSGLDRSRAGEHLEAVAQAVAGTQAVTAGKIDATSISALLSFFGKSGQPGLQGAAGLSQFSKIDERIKAAGFSGGGDPMTSMIYQALGFGTPGGGASFYDATKTAQRGIFGGGGSKTLMDVFNRFSASGGGAGSQETNLMLSKGFGLSLDVVEGIWKAIAESGGNTEGALKKIQEITESQRPINDRILDANLDVAKRIAHLENRNIAIGEKMHKPLEDIQDVMNNTVDRLLPVAYDVLVIIRDLLISIDASISEFVGKRKVVQESGRLAQDIKKNVAGVLPRITSGQVTPESLSLAIANERLRIAKTQVKANAASGLGRILGVVGGSTGEQLHRDVQLSEAGGQLSGLQAASNLKLNPRQASQAVRLMALKAKIGSLQEIRENTAANLIYGPGASLDQLLDAQREFNQLSRQLGKLAQRIEENSGAPRPDVVEPTAIRATGSAPADTTRRVHSAHH